MRTNSTRLEIFYFSMLCLIMSVMVWEALKVMAYFFSDSISDQVVITLLAIGAFLVGSNVRKRSMSTKVFSLVIFLSLAVIGIVFNDLVYRTFPHAAFFTYTVIALSGLMVSQWIPSTEISNSWFIFLGLFFLGVILYYLAPSGTSIYLVVGSAAVLTTVSALKRRYLTAGLYLFFMICMIWTYRLPSVQPRNFASQEKYYDPVVYSKETAFQTVDVTRWRGEYWFYYNTINQFSSIDHWLYFEPMVHPVTELSTSKNKILVIGGENGMIVKELLKYHDIRNIDMLPLDTMLYEVARQNKLFTGLNQNALDHEKVQLIKRTPFSFLSSQHHVYDLIFIDLPDPVDLELNQYYTKEFYELCYRTLRKDGFLITQAGSPYFATRAFYCINNTLQAAGFSTVPMHNQVLTLGEWGWVIGAKQGTAEEVRSHLQLLEFSNIKTIWLNNEAVKMMLSFGKITVPYDSAINSLKYPAVHNYYREGTWKF